MFWALFLLPACRFCSFCYFGSVWFFGLALKVRFHRFRLFWFLLLFSVFSGWCRVHTFCKCFSSSHISSYESLLSSALAAQMRFLIVLHLMCRSSLFHHGGVSFFAFSRCRFAFQMEIDVFLWLLMLTFCFPRPPGFLVCRGCHNGRMRICEGFSIQILHNSTLNC